MYIRSVHSLPTKGSRGARVHRHVGPSNCCEDTQRVRGGLLERGIAVDGGNAEEIQGRGMAGEEDGKSIL